MERFLIKRIRVVRKNTDKDNSETEKTLHFLPSLPTTPHQVLKRNQIILLKNSKVNIVNTMKII